MGARKPDASEWEDEGSASSASSEESDGDSDVFEQPPPKKPKATPPAKGAKKTPARAPAKGAGAGADADAKPKGKAPAKKGQAKGARIETGNFCIELAKTGRANCRVCGSLIAHKSVRLGIEVEDKSWGTIMLWQHVECSRLPLELPFESVAGIDTLDADQVAAAKLTLYATGPPAHLVEVDPDEVLRSSSAVRTKEREPPATITTPLLPFQKIGLAWMCDQELGPVRGGILADEMGMGKTIQTLALIATHRAEQRLPADRAPPSSHPALVDQMGGAASGSASTTICMPCTAAGGTLVVCPVIALVQWQSELVKCTDGSLSVGIYHGNKRQQPAAELAKYDVVLTSYATIEYDYRQTVAQSKEPCEYCGKLLQPDKLEVHLRWYCGPAAQRSAAQSKTEKKLARPGAKGKGAKGKGATTTELKGKGATATKLKGKGATATKLKGKGATIMHLESDDDDDDDSPSASDDDDDGDDGSDRCLSCGGTASSAVNPLLLCDTAGCAGGLHLRCSALKAVPSGDWFCPTCTTRTAAGAKSAPEGKGAPGKGAQQPSKGPAATRIAGAASARGGKRGRAAPSRAGRDSSASDSDADSDFTNGEPSGAEGSSDEEDAHRAALGQAPASRAKRPVRAAGRRKPSGSGARSVLHEVLWQRLVLDEAHAIKDRRSQTAQAIYALRSSLRWALSGTPLQNRVGELYSLVQFLRLDPLSFYCCSAKGCECKSRDYRFTDGWRRCVLCGHSPLQHYSVFNKTILNPIKKFGYVGEGRKAMLALKQGVLDTALLRRTKEERAEDIALPPKLVTVRRDLLDEKELDFYNAIYTQSMAQFDTYVQRGVLLNNCAQAQAQAHARASTRTRTRLAGTARGGSRIRSLARVRCPCVPCPPSLPASLCRAQTRTSSTCSRACGRRSTTRTSSRTRRAPSRSRPRASRPRTSAARRARSSATACAASATSSRTTPCSRAASTPFAARAPPSSWARSPRARRRSARRAGGR
jgi:DNA repair protein RAD16